jgi:hypothetical protein
MTKTLAGALSLISLALAATQLAPSAAAAGPSSKVPEPTRKAARPARTPGPITGSIVLTDRTWVCKGPVNLKSVTVTINREATGDRRPPDAVHLAPGCTGHIGRLDITQWAADGVKAAQGVHDLTIGGGTIRCLAKAPGLHQDGIQIMGGKKIHLNRLTVDCGRPDGTLINSNLFIKRAGRSTLPPTDVVCDHCTFGGGTAHTVSLQSSIRSGITNSVVCTGKFPKLTFAIGPDAVTPVDSGNTVGPC